MVRFSFKSVSSPSLYCTSFIIIFKRKMRDQCIFPGVPRKLGLAGPTSTSPRLARALATTKGGACGSTAFHGGDQRSPEHYSYSYSVVVYHFYNTLTTGRFTGSAGWIPTLHFAP